MNLSPLLLITIAFSAAYFILVVYFLVGWLRLKKTTTAEENHLPFVSVIIPTRNESENIQRCLQSIFAQNYPKHLFEVIVVDDYSTDPTLRLAREMQQPNLLVLDLMQYLGNPGEYSPNKKKAISLGIKNAKGELIITTDGDCTMNQNWLRAMVAAYAQSECKLLTGPVMMKPARWPLEIFQQLDVMNLVAITGATIRNGFPTMCNGANLMYSKQTFLEVEGFKGNMDLPTGDDVFLMQKIEERYPNSIGFVKNFEACVFTKPERTLSGFVSQRIRWISKSSRYSASAVASVLYFAYLFHLLICINGLYVLSGLPMSWLPMAIAGGTKLLVDLIFNLPVTIFFRKPVLLLVYPSVNIFYVLYVVIIGVLSLTGKYRWKDRQIK
ncbi:MAG: glycosyltransferase [Chitinophagales bacterium]|nr:glycosyltransferase [Chitinophagales bacterium]